MAAALAKEFCVECGELVTELVEETGWCAECSGVTTTVCQRCGRASEYTNCSRCRYMLWLERNADEIESVMVTLNIKASKAKRVVADQNRPRCLSCKAPIYRGTKNRDLFCSTKPQCRTASIAYNYHRNVMGRDHNTSIIQALTSAEVMRLLSIVSN